MSGVGLGTALLIGGGLGAAGGIAGAAISGNAAQNAASDQSQAAQQAAQLQYEESQNALNFQKQMWSQQQANEAPWLNSGAGALSNLDYMLGIAPPTTQGLLSGEMPSQGNQGSSSGGIGGQSGPPPIGIRPTPQGSGESFIGPNGQQVNNSSGAIRSVGPTAFGGIGTPGSSGPISLSGGSFGSPAMPPPGASFEPASGPSAIFRPTGVPAMPSGFQPFTPLGNQGNKLIPNPSVPSGQTNLGSMVNPSLGGFGSLMQNYPGQFQAPTGLDMQNDPGYQARLKLAQQTMEQSAAARGNLLTGGTLQAENQLGQDYASNEYNNVYNRAFNTYAQNYNQYEQGQQNQFNRLAALSGIGQTSAGQLGYMGGNAAQGITGNLLSTGANIGQQMNNAAAANASGIVGSANAWGGALSGVGSNIGNLLMMQQLLGGGGGQSYANIAGNLPMGGP